MTSLTLVIQVVLLIAFVWAAGVTLVGLWHAVDGYLAKLLKKGYRIAICDQMEDPKAAVGIVKREVTKIITPGTVLSDAVLEDKHNQYLACLEEDGEEICASFADISTGECAWYVTRGENRLEFVLDQLFRLQPAELIAVGAISGWEQISTALGQKLPECVVGKFSPDKDINYFAQHFKNEAATPPDALVRNTVEAMPVATKRAGAIMHRARNKSGNPVKRRSSP